MKENINMFNITYFVDRVHFKYFSKDDNNE